MKQTIAVMLLASVLFFNCGDTKKTIDFKTLQYSEFNAAPFNVSIIKSAIQAKQEHDSCMGFSFDANAVFSRTMNKFFVGNVVNRQTLAIVNTFTDLGLTQAGMLSDFNILTNPCYEKRRLQLPLKSLLGDTFHIQLPGADAAQNKEINNAVAASAEVQIETGSWVYMDMEDALKRILDTVQTVAGLQYKKNLLDTSNMILTAMESITDLRFTINTPKDMSESLQNLLRSKPAVTDSSAQVSLQLAYVNSNQVRISFNGFFPVAGRFMKAVTE